MAYVWWDSAISKTRYGINNNTNMIANEVTAIYRY